jgi:E3 ubiquitin-protein ligase TRIP12
MSESYPSLLLDTSHGNVLDAVLSFIDFFQVGMQRIAVATAANVCRIIASVDGRHLPSDKDGALDALTSLFRGSVPALLQLTTSSDNKIALSAFQALTSIAKICSLADVPVESVIDVDCMQMVLGRLVAVGGTNVAVKPCVFYAMTRFVSTYTSTSVEIPKRLLDQQAPCVVANILALLSTKAQAASVGVMGSLKDLKPRNQDELFVLLSLVDNMLPPVLASDLRVFDRSKTKREMKTLEAEGLVVRDPTAGPRNLESMRSALLDEGMPKPAVNAATAADTAAEAADVVEVVEVVEVTESSRSRLDAVAPMLLDALLHLEFATLSRDSKMGVLSVVDKILFYASPACLSKLVAELPVSVFVIRLLQSSNHVAPHLAPHLAGLVEFSRRSIRTHSFRRVPEVLGRGTLCDR